MGSIKFKEVPTLRFFERGVQFTPNFDLNTDLPDSRDSKDLIRLEEKILKKLKPDQYVIGANPFNP